ncbi:hypothetical protein SeseC_00399 [Streptococcus equi subsp. zooepidemicus ATCC 35246]|nr:hypothetical protein SeseC_00399 [Streptococcus equi subsp. zooepidemicus ATCC 35246]
MSDFSADQEAIAGLIKKQVATVLTCFDSYLNIPFRVLHTE